jgi:hypothetical protein
MWCGWCAIVNTNANDSHFTKNGKAAQTGYAMGGVWEKQADAAMRK